MSLFKKLFTRLNAMQWAIVTFILVSPCSAFASQTGTYAWETILDKIATSLQGPVAYAVSIMAIVVTGCVMAFADMQGGAKKFVQAACGLSIVIFSTQIVTGFLGFSGSII